MLFDVENDFNRDGRYFPIEARDLIRERFQYRREYKEMQEHQEEQQQIADFIGGGVVMQSLSDDIIDDMRNPRAEIMDIDMTEYATEKESVVPEDIKKFAYKNPSFFTKIMGRFVNFLRRRK